MLDILAFLGSNKVTGDSVTNSNFVATMIGLLTIFIMVIGTMFGK
jgi:hypothetical protein